ncbi:DUF4340 domain-containing protein [Ethanoligenens harbinense]|uniref:DUF4340 domain-containing protein n=1 Tax=Ethanoligenens harbinense (strain DSM 18485 / JCM 12961 / CGMCC 1.5033 / YUAN-3) TaxID=663278 RepID=E6U7D3_ETHHY|nr:DUF4340 domain-containing protein [Ethanoligenens harbinense]ADU25868.1 hypothetical protein Ethha_0282 [Ethanoligenens harbinense YUAN-3]AVQ95029.1 DUF4340 domain-containing protein [Ethanoligenens harbinense YUAN-3]AYF37721.1 DUF4340 domain-containing protein [Ethanoligenens harbinense]AYF40441.1 DUF4340 domain-containing protein [Ethanoligenens harbinense]QCN91276.1 DUF4340 domain-containing protein [Ethanoligenens harbinense]
MTRQVRNLVIVVCVAVALGAGVLLLNVLPGNKKTGSSSSSSSSGSISLLSIKSSAFHSLHVTNAAGSYTVTLTGGTYTVDTLKDAPSNQSAIQSKVNDVLGLKATTLIQKDATDLAQYGLTTPAATLDVATADGKTSTVKIGSQAPSGSGVYILKPGTNDVYLSSTMMNDNFSQSAMQYASTTVSALGTSANISAYKFGGTARSTPFTVAVKTQSSAASSGSSATATYTYALTQPYAYDGNDTNLGKITTALQSLSATSVVSVDVSPQSLAQYGLQNPAYTLTYTVDGKDTTLSFGNADSSSNTVYMTISDKKAVYQVDTSSAAAFYNYQLSDVLSTALVTSDISTVKTLTIQSGSETHTFNLSGSSDKLAVTDANGKKIDATSFRNYYQTILAITTRGGADRPAGVSSSLTLTFTYNDGTAQRTVSFLPDGSDKSFVDINGSGGLYVYNSQISNLLTLAQNLEAGKTVSASS